MAENIVVNVTEFAKSKGMSEMEIEGAVKSYFEGGDNFGAFLRRLGGISSQRAVEAAYRALYIKLTEEMLVAGQDYHVKFLNWQVKDFPEKDKVTKLKVQAKDSMGIPKKDAKGKPVWATYKAVVGFVEALNPLTGERKIARVMGYREIAVNNILNAHIIPLEEIYKVKMKEGKDDETGEPVFTIPSTPVKFEKVVPKPDFVDMTPSIMKIGTPIPINDVRVTAERDHALSAAAGDKSLNYKSYRFSGQVIFAPSPASDNRYGKLVMMNEEQIVTSQELLNERKVSVMVAPELISVIGRNSLVHVVGSLQYDPQWGAQCYAELVYPQVSNDQPLIFKSEEEKVQAAGFNPSTAIDARESAANIPAATSQMSSIPQEPRMFNPTILTPPPVAVQVVAPVTQTPGKQAHVAIPAPAPIPATPTPAPVPVQPVFVAPVAPVPPVQTVIATPPQDTGGCQDENTDCDPTNATCKACTRVLVCLDKSMAHLGAELGKSVPGSLGQMTILGKLTNMAKAKAMVSK